MSQSLTVLAERENHRNLLLAEAAAWLHDFWKCTDEHIKRQALENESSEKVPYKGKYLELVGSHQVTLLKDSASFKALIRRNGRDKTRSWLVRTLAHCHNVAHTEKEDVFYHMLKQPEANTRSSSSFGCESRPLRRLSDRLYRIPFDQIGNRSFRVALAHAFRNVPADTQRPINEVTLWDWSDIVAALYKAALAASVLTNTQEDPSKMRWRLLSVRLNGTAFLERVARIPDLLVRQKLITNGLNRVCKLLEHAYPLGTEVYRDEDGSVFIVPDIKDLLQLENQRGDTLSDLIKRAFSTGTIYKNDKYSKDASSLRLDGEVVPLLKPDEESWSRKKSHEHQKPLPIADHVKEVLTHADPDSMKRWWQGYKEDICTVCQLRPQGWEALDYTDHNSHRARGEKYRRGCQTCKALERRVCGICERRREDRSRDWATKERCTTIWIDEIADVNGRIALVVGKFDLEQWIAGKMLFYPAELTALQVRCLSTPPIEGQVFEISGDESSSEEESMSEEDSNSEGEYYVWNETLKALVSIRQVKEELVPGQGQIFCEAPLQETSPRGAMKLVKTPNSLSDFLEVERSFKIPSMVETQTPARLHRVWETTRTFWEETKQNFRKSVGEVHPRLRIRVQETFVLADGTLREEGKIDKALGNFHAYELKLGSVNLSVVYCGEGEFLTVDNLERMAILLNPSKKPLHYTDAANYVLDRLVEENKKPEGIHIEQPTGYGNPNKSIGRLHLIGEEPSLDDTLERTRYTPATAILIEPRTFMAIVPANKALCVAHSIKKKYKTEMGKVRNRLPLTVGIVFAERHTPLPAILDAGRRMLKQPTADECWKIDKVNISSLPKEVRLTLKKGEQLSLIKVPLVMGDGTTEDAWYTYWHVEKDANATAPSGRQRQFKGINGEDWVHIRDLRPGDHVHFMPSRFDFEFLDTAARRFEVSYENGKRRGSRHPRRPYYLEELKDFECLWEILAGSKGLTTSQIHNLIGFIETKRLEWETYKGKSVFEQIVRDALDNAEWETHPRKYLDPEKFEQLCQAAINGQLADVVELYMRILKIKTAVDKMEGGN